MRFAVLLLLLLLAFRILLPSLLPRRLNISTKRKLSSKKELDDFTRASIKIDLDVHLPELVTSRESRTFCAVSP